MGRTVVQQYIWPLRFLKIRFPGKSTWMLLFPLLGASGAGIVFYLLPAANLAHDRGLLDISAGLLSMLVGFFVAALGVVMALPPGRIDSAPDEHANPPRDLDGTAVTWRAFAVSVTAYLVFVALITYLLSTAAMVVHPGLSLQGETRHILRITGAVVYTFLFLHVLSVTLFALFLVAAKLPEVQHTPRKAVKPVREIEPKPSDEKAS